MRCPQLIQRALDASERLFGRTTEARFALLKLTMKSMAIPEKVTPLKRAL